jgi:hypothetical protein
MRIANNRGLTYHEVNEIFKSQFAFAAEELSKYSKEDLANMTEEELKKLSFNFIYLGKLFTNKKLQEYGNKKNNLKQGDEE